jgi:Glyoxalase-like domain
MLRLRQIALVAKDLEPIMDDFKAVLGLEICYRDPGVAEFGLHNALVQVGGQFIEVVSPIRENTAGGRYLDRRKGDGGYMVILQSDNHAARKQHVEQMKIRKVAESDTASYHLMQLHPRDTGGSFLEIDEQVGGEDMKGPWMPAGKNWQQAIRTNVVNAIVAAEIQSPDHRDLAQKWADILKLPLQNDAAGNPSVRLDNSTIRFVKDQDGRGEGLGGLDLAAVDRKRALEEAKRRGRLNGDQIAIAGMRLNLVEPR